MSKTKSYKSKPAPAKIVTRNDIENKLREVSNTIENETNSSKDKMQIALVAIFGVGIALAYMSGRRRALRKKTYVTFVKTR